ncbi:MAG: alpha/beta hydrolase [Bifidobacteriaceae bacterium]|jgi:pimeloyl-ACP methyl ester carboxylesterase|nr:alpha/beta hydrolase [Bifidobacteriaceae bacterium]
MPEVRLPTHVPRRKPPLRKRALQAVGWAAFVGGGVATPRLAAKAATRVWCKIPGNPGRRKDNRPWLGELAMVDVGLNSPLAVETWEPFSRPGLDTPAAAAPRQATPDGGGQDQGVGTASANGDGDGEPKTVLLMHGWGGWRGQVAAFVEPLTEAGFKVVAADALSHGDSGPGPHGPRHSSGAELMDSFDALVKATGQPHGVIAHSLGCAAACRSLLEGRLTADRLTLVSPSPDMVRVAEAFARSLGFGPRPTRMLFEEMEKWTGRRLADFDIAQMGGAGLLPDALVIHDAVDKESPYRTSQLIAAQWPGANLVTTQGLGHHRILIDPEVVRRAAANITA